MPVRASAATNLTRLSGVIPVVDSENRDRWGIDGYHAARLCDGALPTEETQAWGSDNWEVTHTAGLVFPQHVRIHRVDLIWWKKLSARRGTLQGWREGKWID